MLTGIDKLTESGCSPEQKDKICRSRGGESCAFDGAMIVLQPIADAAHIVHGPIACCGNSWEGRGALSSKGELHKMGFTTDMNEMNIIYGSEDKLYKAILDVNERIKPKAIFVYATCVSGLIGEDIEAVCKKAAAEINIKVIPVNAPGFVGPKNLGNRIAGEVLLDYVIGTGEPPEGDSPDSTRLSFPQAKRVGNLSEGKERFRTSRNDKMTTECDFADEVININLIGEYNIAGDLCLVEQVLKKAGIEILSRITGNSTFEEITYAHKAKLNVVVCSRALINIAKEMERKYGIPYIEVSFFGKTEMSKALKLIASKLDVIESGAAQCHSRESGNPEKTGCRIKSGMTERIELFIEREERLLDKKLDAYKHLKGKKAVLYTGGVKSWSFISALIDLGIDVVAVGTKKSSFEDEEKMKNILGENAPLIEDVSPKNLLKLMREKNADILVAGGRNQYLAIKEGFPFVDVNQERHIAYAGYEGLVNLAEQISSSLRFYGRSKSEYKSYKTYKAYEFPKTNVLINPLKHSQSIGAAIAFQGIHNAIPVIHGAQGCSFLAKVLLTKHFREPIALASTKLFTEDVVMGSEGNILKTVEKLIEDNNPDVIGILTSGLSEVKGDDLLDIVGKIRIQNSETNIVPVATPDYEGGLESGYANAIAAVIGSIASNRMAEVKANSYQLGCESQRLSAKGYINVLAGSHLTPADFTELREMIESFGLKPIMLPDLSALDGSRRGFSPLAIGGADINDIRIVGLSEFTIAVGASMESPARILKEKFGIEYRVFESLSGLKDVDMFIETLSMLSNRPVAPKYRRQRNILIDGIRDAHFYFGNKKICIASEPDLAIQASRLFNEMGAEIELAVIPAYFSSSDKILAKDVVAGDFFSIEGNPDLIISNSHAEDTAERLGIPLYQMGFPVYKILGNTAKKTIGYTGTLTIINEVANLIMRGSNDKH